MPDFSSSQFWTALVNIVAINIMLSGDNAIVIALACRSLPPRQRRIGVFFGALCAILLRVILTVFALTLLKLAYLKIVGALLLLWVGVNLLKPIAVNDHNIQGSTRLTSTIKIIIIADFVMSLDNVLGVAAAAKGDVFLLVFGLVLSIPLIIFGSQFALKIMDRFPMTIVVGAGLLGWVGGEMGIADSAIIAWVTQHFPLAHWIAPALSAALVVTIGLLLKRRALKKASP